MSEAIAVSLALTADARNVRQARQVLRGALLHSGAEHLIDDATLVLSEIITSAFVHGGRAVRLDLWASESAVRVEVEDGVSRVPTQRGSTETDEPGRGLLLLDALVDRWGTTAHETGKTVWFEIGRVVSSSSPGPSAVQECTRLPL